MSFCAQFKLCPTGLPWKDCPWPHPRKFRRCFFGPLSPETEADTPQNSHLVYNQPLWAWPGLSSCETSEQGQAEPGVVRATTENQINDLLLYSQDSKPKQGESQASVSPTPPSAWSGQQIPACQLYVHRQLTCIAHPPWAPLRQEYWVARSHRVAVTFKGSPPA